MRNKKIKIIAGILILAVLAVFFIVKNKNTQTNGEITKEIKPARGRIQNMISSTGTVLPKNRLEIKPPVNGRVDEVLVKEGEQITVGQTLAWMSSTERAALLDAARGQGEETLEYWKQAYKAIPLISPISGEVIVSTTQPGQTVTTSDAVVVLSDQLIVRAQVDETDIGKVKLGQSAVIVLDAYPDNDIKAEVEHIYYESETVNNVTIYKVDLIPQIVPLFFRSGMNATINFIENSKDDAILLPSDAILRDKEGSYVLLKETQGKLPVKRAIQIGISDDKNTEVISGIGLNDTVIVKEEKYSLPQTTTTTNPFMPSRRR